MYNIITVHGELIDIKETEREAKGYVSSKVNLDVEDLLEANGIDPDNQEAYENAYELCSTYYIINKGNENA